MFCRQCGSQVPDDSAFCPRCGTKLEGGANDNIGYRRAPDDARPAPGPEDTGSAGWGILGFFFPIIGFILWLVWRTERPRSARAAGLGTLVGTVFIAIGIVIYIVLVVSLFGMLRDLGGDVTIGLIGLLF